jgi:prepilin-type N-terminal cleavage/methylation domain-containing protein
MENLKNGRVPDAPREKRENPPRPKTGGAAAAAERGFTLVEVLIALAIGGIIIAAGVAPLMFTVRTLARSRDDFARANMERTAVNRIFQDAREMNPLNCETPFRLWKSENLVMDDGGYLAVWTSATSYYDLPVSSVVWGVPRESVLDTETRTGLYRWVISGDATPRSIDMGALDPASGSLSLPDVRSVSFSALDGEEWNDSYEGAFPRALRVTLKYDEGEAIYEEMLPRF